jgi:SAM-dependent methyltransferase
MPLPAGEPRPSFAGRARRALGIQLEALYWRWWMFRSATRHSEIYRRAMERERPLDAFHRQFVDQIAASRVRILEVGSGPLSAIGTVHPAKTLEIVATDLLADTYARLLAHLRIEPAVRTVRADAERLAEQFAEGSFDYVTANNCIDHCARADQAIEQMLRVARPGGWVSLRHAENEASRTRYFGMHEWNFALEGGEPVLWNRRERIPIRGLVAPQGELKVLSEPGHVVFAVRRHGVS